MMRVLIAGAVLLLTVGIVGCSGGGSDGAEEGSRWEEVSGTLTPGLDETAANPCQRGDRTCLDIVLAEMERRVAPLASACDHDALFATMYLRMTEQVRDAFDAGQLVNPAASAHLTAWFAHYYFNAYDDWHSGSVDAVPEVWRVAFGAAEERNVRGLGNLLLGMNAHVSRDLAFTVEDVLSARADDVDPDYALVNSMIADLSEGLIDEVAERFDPSLATASFALSFAGADSFGALVTLWRADSWVKGNALLGATAGERADLATRVELESLARALALLPEVSYLPFIEGPQGRDAFCESQS